MARDLLLACSCGRLGGVVLGVTRNNARRLSCLCDDCQAYARFLGRADEILDVYGGTDLSYATPGRVSFTHGQEQLRCVRLTAQGLLRWYADCCKTPIAHTPPSHRIAFVGIPHLALHGRDAEARDRDLGPLRCRVQARFAIVKPPAPTHLNEPASVRARDYASILWATLRGQNRPTPFFDADGAPTIAPTVLTSEERRRLETPRATTTRTS